jgi:hypothetical protein
VTEVAQRAGVNLSTLAKHEDLYLQVREQHQDAIEQAESARRESAIAEAEATYARLVSSGTRPTLRAASALTKESWRESQLRGMSLTLLRISGREAAEHPRPLRLHRTGIQNNAEKGRRATA